jgi:hypothetical protein
MDCQNDLAMSAMMSNALANTNARRGADVVPGWRYTPRKCLTFIAVVRSSLQYESHWASNCAR